MTQLIGLALLVGVPVRGLRPLPMLVAAVLAAAMEIAVVRTRPAALVRYRETVSGVAHSLRSTVGVFWRNPATVFLGLLVTAAYVWRVALGSFVLPVEWDGMWYHLVGPAVWIQNGQIGHTPAAFWSDVYPQGQELLGAWAGVFTHTLRWSWAATLPFLLLGFTAAVSLARRFGARRDHALLAGFGFLTTPAVLAQTATSYVDVGAATTAAAAFQFVLATPSGSGEVGGRLRHLWLAGIALALGTSVKASNLLTMACVFAVGIAQVVLAVLAERRSVGREATGFLRSGVTQSAMLSAALIVPSVLLSSYWYVRTWMAHGNPFYPFTMFGFSGRGTVHDLIMVNNTPKVILEAGGVPAQLWESWTTPIAAGFSYDQRLGGLGGGWVWVLLPAVLAGTVLFAVRRQWALLLGLLLPMAVMAAASPGPWWARYTLYLPVLGGVFLAVLLTWIGGTEERPAGSVAWGRWAGSVAVGLGLAVAATGPMWAATEPTYLPVSSDGSHLRAATIDETVGLMRNRTLQQKQLWPWNTFTNVRKLPNGSVIAITDKGPDIRLPLMGLKMERELVQVDSTTDLATLRADLKRSGAGFLALDPAGESDAQLLAQVQTDPGHFRLVSGNDPIRIFALDGI
ncbi:hypothetical protein ACF9IK_16345 [Kitasatospora hibisci]|uniref:hypothetical protein n=1 Tax=Kitasatospora hibisci TaxID=3369522 RepID=UPI003754EC7F